MKAICPPAPFFCSLHSASTPAVCSLPLLLLLLLVLPLFLLPPCLFILWLPLVLLFLSTPAAYTCSLSLVSAPTPASAGPIPPALCSYFCSLLLPRFLLYSAFTPAPFPAFCSYHCSLPLPLLLLLLSSESCFYPCFLLFVLAPAFTPAPTLPSPWPRSLPSSFLLESLSCFLTHQSVSVAR